jgi:hypothetical protein
MMVCNWNGMLLTYCTIHRRYAINFTAGFNAEDDIDSDFYDSIIEKEEEFIRTVISPPLRNFIERTMNDLRKDPDTEVWVPQIGKSGFCKECHINHELVFYEI